LSFFIYLGYLAIQLLGLSVGTIILPPFPSFFRRRQKMLINKRRNSDLTTTGNADSDITAPRQTEKTATELCSFAIIWWSLLGLVRFFKVDGTWGPDGGVSRRMVKEKNTQL
jgi:glucosaminylphosphatidylinositol acyltransferase